MAFIDQTSLGLGNGSSGVPIINVIITAITIDVGASMQIEDNGGAIRIASPGPGPNLQGMVINTGSFIQILGI
jgi:hypothetical protein